MPAQRCGGGSDQGNPTCHCCGKPGHGKPDRRRNENCGTRAKKGHAGQVCRSGEGHQAECPRRGAEEDPIKETQRATVVASLVTENPIVVATRIAAPVQRRVTQVRCADQVRATRPNAPRRGAEEDPIKETQRATVVASLVTENPIVVATRIAAPVQRRVTQVMCADQVRATRPNARAEVRRRIRSRKPNVPLLWQAWSPKTRSSSQRELRHPCKEGSRRSGVQIR